MRLSKLFGTLVVTAMAFALFGANAMAATSSTQTLWPMSGGTQPFTVHINEPRTSHNEDCALDPVLLDESLKLCGHVIFSTSVAGTLSATITYNTGPDDLNLFSLAFCVLDSAGTCTGVFFDQTSPNCTFTMTGDTGPNATVTETLTCSDVPAGSYELLVVPNFFSNCGIDPLCTSFVGTDIKGSLAFNPSGGTGTGGGGTTSSKGPDKVTGGGQVGQNNSFSVEGTEGTTKGHVRLALKGVCSFRSTSITFTLVDTPNHAHLEGRGVAKSSSGVEYPPENFVVDAFDNGSGSGAVDQFSLKSTHCSNPNVSVTSGNIKIHFSSV
jgi:hypothetical protein